MLLAFLRRFSCVFRPFLSFLWKNVTSVEEKNIGFRSRRFGTNRHPSILVGNNKSSRLSLCRSQSVAVIAL